MSLFNNILDDRQSERIFAPASATASPGEDRLFSLPQPERMAFCYFREILANNKNNNVVLKPAEEIHLYKLIVLYESLTLDPGDFILYNRYYDDEQKVFLRARVHMHKENGMPAIHCIIQAIQELQIEEDRRNGSPRPSCLPAHRIETAIRNRKFNELYGYMTMEQARHLVERHLHGEEEVSRVAAWNARTHSTLIDYLTESREAQQKGLRSYIGSRMQIIEKYVMS